MRDLHGSICVCPECERPGSECGYCRGLYCPECASCRGVPDDDLDEDADERLVAAAIAYGLVIATDPPSGRQIQTIDSLYMWGTEKEFSPAFGGVAA